MDEYKPAMTTTWICGPRRYEYEGVIIELGGIGGPCPVKPNGDPYERWPADVRAAVNAWWKLPEQYRETYRIGGGCWRVQ